VSNPDRLYWDSATFLDWLTGEHANHAVMQLVIDDWEKGLVTMVTSAVTLAEVLFVRMPSTGRVDKARERDIDALFNPPPGRRLIIVETSRLTAYKARDLARNFSIGPRDAIHIASAIEGRCSTMHTTDAALWQKSGTVGGDPVLRIEAPSWTHEVTMDEIAAKGAADPIELPPPSSLSPDDAPG
jgi:predicted nucleic acid-binding protein